MNARAAKKLRKLAAAAQREYLQRHKGELSITLRHRIAFSALKLAARLGFPVKVSTLEGIARRGARLILRNAA